MSGIQFPQMQLDSYYKRVVEKNHVKIFFVDFYHGRKLNSTEKHFSSSSTNYQQYKEIVGFINPHQKVLSL